MTIFFIGKIALGNILILLVKKKRTIALITLALPLALPPAPAPLCSKAPPPMRMKRLCPAWDSIPRPSGF